MIPLLHPFRRPSVPCGHHDASTPAPAIAPAIASGMRDDDANAKDRGSAPDSLRARWGRAVDDPAYSPPRRIDSGDSLCHAPVDPSADAAVARDSDFVDVLRILGACEDDAIIAGSRIRMPTSATWRRILDDVLGPWRMDRVIDVMSLADSVGFGMNLEGGMSHIYDTHRHLEANLRHGPRYINRPGFAPDARAALYLLDVVMHPDEPNYMDDYLVNGINPNRMHVVPLIGAMCARGFAWMADMLGSFLRRADSLGLPAMMESDHYGAEWPCGVCAASPFGPFGLVVGYVAESPDWRGLLSGDGVAFGTALADAWAWAYSLTEDFSRVAVLFPSVSLYDRWRRAVAADASAPRPIRDEWGMAWLFGGDEGLGDERCRIVYDRVISAIETEAADGVGIRDYAAVLDWLSTVDDSWSRRCRGLEHPDIVGVMDRPHPGPFELPGTGPERAHAEAYEAPEEMLAMITDMGTPGALLAALDVSSTLLGLAESIWDDRVRRIARGEQPRWVRFPPAAVVRVATLLDNGYPRDMVLENPMLHAPQSGRESESTPSDRA